MSAMTCVSDTLETVDILRVFQNPEKSTASGTVPEATRNQGRVILLSLVLAAIWTLGHCEARMVVELAVAMVKSPR